VEHNLRRLLFLEVMTKRNLRKKERIMSSLKRRAVRKM
jgi:hypothetical protein